MRFIRFCYVNHNIDRFHKALHLRKLVELHMNYIELCVLAQIQLHVRASLHVGVVNQNSDVLAHCSNGNC